MEEMKRQHLGAPINYASFNLDLEFLSFLYPPFNPLPPHSLSSYHPSSLPFSFSFFPSILSSFLPSFLLSFLPSKVVYSAAFCSQKRRLQTGILARQLTLWFLYKVVIQKQLRTQGSISAIWSVQGICLDRELKQIRFFSLIIPSFTTYSGLPFDITTMINMQHQMFKKEWSLHTITEYMRCTRCSIARSSVW